MQAAPAGLLGPYRGLKNRHSSKNCYAHSIMNWRVQQLENSPLIHFVHLIAQNLDILFVMA